jgi:hypothetical protein
VRGATFPRDIHVSCPARKPLLHRCASYMNPVVSPLNFPLNSPHEKNRTFGPLPTMDNVIFYQPPSTSSSQPPRLPAALTASIVPEEYIASFAVRQPASQLNQRNEMWTEHTIKCRDVSNLPQQRHSPNQYYGNDPIKEKGTCRDSCHNRCMLISRRKLDSNAKFPERRR